MCYTARMPVFGPFAPVRFGSDHDLAQTVAPPYDVISPSLRERLAASTHNLVHVTLPRPANDPAGYAAAGALWGAWLDEGVLEASSDPAMFLYRSEFTHGTERRTATGLVGALELARFGEGDIHPHERTTPGPKADRLELMRTTEANLEPLWFFSSQPIAGFGQLVSQGTGRPPTASVAIDDVTHSLWQLEPDEAAEMSDAIRDVPIIVADGHHRYETSVTYRDERRAVDGPGPWDSTLALVMDVEIDSPSVLPIHRIITFDDALALAHALGTPRETQADPGQLERLVARAGPGTVGVVTSDRSWLIATDAGLDTVAVADAIERLGAVVAYEHSIDELSEQVSAGKIGILLAPVGLKTVAEMARTGVRMPPKTTLFWPKPVSGLVMRSLRG